MLEWFDPDGKNMRGSCPLNCFFGKTETGSVIWLPAAGSATLSPKRSSWSFCQRFGLSGVFAAYPEQAGTRPHIFAGCRVGRYVRGACRSAIPELWLPVPHRRNAGRLAGDNTTVRRQLPAQLRVVRGLRRAIASPCRSGKWRFEL